MSTIDTNPFAQQFDRIKENEFVLKGHILDAIQNIRRSAGPLNDRPIDDTRKKILFNLLKLSGGPIDDDADECFSKLWNIALNSKGQDIRDAAYEALLLAYIAQTHIKHPILVMELIFGSYLCLSLPKARSARKLALTLLYNGRRDFSALEQHLSLVECSTRMGRKSRLARYPINLLIAHGVLSLGGHHHDASLGFL